jgi:ribosomal protein L17
MGYDYIHVGVGFPGSRSYTLSLCKKFTSTCLHNSYIRSSVDVYVASVVDDVFEKFRWNIEELKNPFHEYKSYDRVYLVYKYDDKLYGLIKSIFDLAIFINSYKWTQKNKWNIINGIIAECSDVESCIETIHKRIDDIRQYIKKLRKAGKKAFLSRLTRNTERCKPIIDKYFSDLYNYPVFDVYSVTYSSCVEKSINVLTKFFDQNVARRYADRICGMRSSVYLFARDSIFAIKTSNTTEYFRLFCDDCIETDKYVVVKLVGAKVFDNEIDRVDWIAVLGLDKYTNQIFLHYVPKTLVLRDVETCRKWILGIVDEYGRTVGDVELVEV